MPTLEHNEGRVLSRLGAASELGRMADRTAQAAEQWMNGELGDPERDALRTAAEWLGSTIALLNDPLDLAHSFQGMGDLDALGAFGQPSDSLSLLQSAQNRTQSGSSNHPPLTEFLDGLRSLLLRMLDDDREADPRLVVVFFDGMAEVMLLSSEAMLLESRPNRV